MLPVFIMAIENDDDRTFVAELYARCQPAMQRRALSILKNESDAEEAVHEAKETPMKLYEYWLGLHPLDWEFCFMSVQTYKNFITEQYHKNTDFYNISAGSIEKVLAHIDAILSAAMENWNKTTNHAALRCPPMIFPLPKGQESHAAEFAVILKMDHDGDTVVYSPIPLPHLENQ